MLWLTLVHLVALVAVHGVYAITLGAAESLVSMGDVALVPLMSLVAWVTLVDMHTITL